MLNPPGNTKLGQVLASGADRQSTTSQVPEDELMKGADKSVRQDAGSVKYEVNTDSSHIPWMIKSPG